MAGSDVAITLTRAQVDRVVRQAAQGDGAAGRLRPLSSAGMEIARYRELAESPRLSRSLLLGLLVLASFPADGSSTAVTDVATQLDMSPSTTHRYLSTLLAVGLLEQDPRSRRYHLPAAD
jgi:IclR-like helix-turn-helix domain-containing protein